MFGNRLRRRRFRHQHLCYTNECATIRNTSVVVPATRVPVIDFINLYNTQIGEPIIDLGEVQQNIGPKTSRKKKSHNYPVLVPLENIQEMPIVEEPEQQEVQEQQNDVDYMEIEEYDTDYLYAYVYNEIGEPIAIEEPEEDVSFGLKRTAQQALIEDPEPDKQNRDELEDK